MRRRDPERLEKLRIAVRYLLSSGKMKRGHQSRLAEHFDVSRQWVNRVVRQEEDVLANVVPFAEQAVDAGTV